MGEMKIRITCSVLVFLIVLVLLISKTNSQIGSDLATSLGSIFKVAGLNDNI